MSADSPTWGLGPQIVNPQQLLAPYRTDLWLPRYRAGAHGDWSMRVIFTAAARGYWGDSHATSGTAILTGPVADGAATWMSIVPMEVESQEIGIAAARGHTAVLGLGMGWAAANIALNPAVTRVTVVERDPSVIALIHDLGVFEQLPDAARDKVTIVNADAFDWRPDTPVDSLQADIWAKIVEPRKWDDIRRLHATIGAASLYFWGQEMELWRLACRAAGCSPDGLTRAALDDLVTTTGLPLVMSDAADLGERMVSGARWWTPQSDGWWV
jgi:hypothetical protein